LLLGLAFAVDVALAVSLEITTVFGAVGKWESRVFDEIPKGVWETVETCFGGVNPKSVRIPGHVNNDSGVM